MSIKERLQEIFRDLFDDGEIELYDEMTADDIEDWDSLSHINLIADIERTFGIKFKTEEVVSTRNVGEFIELIEIKLNK